MNWIAGTRQLQELRLGSFERFSELAYRLKGKTDEMQKCIERFPVEVVVKADKDYKNLEALRLSKGQKSNNTPVYSKLIYAFRSVEDMARKIVGLPDGFALVALMSDNPADSYFAIVCKNGERITVLSDSPNYEHPLQEERMAKRNNRYNHSRMDGSMFPYDLFDLQWSDGDRIVNQGSSRKELVDPKTQIEVLGTIENLSEVQAIWLSYIFESCYFEYFIGESPAKTMAVLCKETLRIGGVKEESSNLPSLISDTVIDLPPSSELTGDKLLEHYPQIHLAEENTWMERRFEKYIDATMLYPLDDPGQMKLEFKGLGRSKSNLAVSGKELCKLPTTKLLSAENAKRDSLYIARHNKAQLIQKMVNEEFEARGKKISDWVYKHISENVPNIIDDLVSLNHSRFYESSAMGGSDKDGETVRQIHIVKNTSAYIKERSVASELIKRLGLYEDGWPLCYVSENLLDESLDSADHFIVLQVKTVWDLVNLTGVQRSELPEELQHYCYNKKGRVSILDASDEMRGVTNPYNQLRFTFSLPVHKKSLNRYRKQLGLRAITKLPVNYWDATPSEGEGKQIYGYLTEKGKAYVVSESKPDFIHYTTSEIKPVKKSLKRYI